MLNKFRWTYVLVVASLLAATPGWTKDEVTETGDRIASAADASKELARKANHEAAEEASEALKATTRLDLDIQLIGATSVKIAGKR